jgi:hypothetical protein
MKSALALFSLVASVSAEASGIVCAKQADCTAANACCAYWKDNDTAATKKMTCQSAPVVDTSSLLIDAGSLTVKTVGTTATASPAVPYLCMASSFLCPTDNSATEC